jgi:hypothetical protein
MKTNKFLALLFGIILLASVVSATEWGVGDLININEGLVSYYPFSESYGLEANSSIGGFPLISNIPLTECNGLIGNCLNSSSVRGLNQNNSNWQDGMNKFTFNIWMNQSIETVTFLLSVGAIDTPTKAFIIRPYTSPQIIFNFIGGEGYTSVDTYYDDGLWHMISWTNNGSLNTVYYDASPIGTFLTTPEIANATDVYKPLSVGKARDGDIFFDGFIDELGIWNRSLNGTEISALYNSREGVAFVQEEEPPVEEPAPQVQGTLYQTIAESGAGLGIFMQLMSRALPVLLIMLALVAVIAGIGYGIAQVIKKGFR